MGGTQKITPTKIVDQDSQLPKLEATITTIDPGLNTIREESRSDLGASQPDLQFPPFTRHTADNSAPFQKQGMQAIISPKADKIYNAARTKRRLMNSLGNNLKYYDNELKLSFDDVMATVQPTYEEHVSGAVARRKKGKISNKFYLR